MRQMMIVVVAVGALSACGSGTTTQSSSKPSGSVQLSYDLQGESAAQVSSELTGDGLIVSATQPIPNAVFPKGTVIDVVQGPGNDVLGQSVPVGSSVQLVVSSSGTSAVKVPYVAGSVLGFAKSYVTGPPYNFQVTVVSVHGTAAGKGTVVSTDPAGGASVAPGSSLTLTVDEGP